MTAKALHIHTDTNTYKSHTQTPAHTVHLQRVLNYLWVGGEVTKMNSDSNTVKNEKIA